MNEFSQRTPSSESDAALNAKLLASRNNGMHPSTNLGDRGTPQPSTHHFWPFPGMVFLLIGINVIIVAVTAYLAGNDPSFAVEPDYYNRAVRWNQTAAQRSQNDALGWIVSIEPIVGGQPVAIHVSDQSGAPVDGARVAFTCFHHADASDRLSTTMDEIEPGTHCSTQSLLRPGVWEFNFTIARGSDVFTHSRSIIVDSPTGGRP